MFPPGVFCVRDAILMELLENSTQYLFNKYLYLKFMILTSYFNLN
jgi:hypothetical protein